MAFGLVVNSILWITLLSREPGRYEILWKPLSLYVYIFRGEWTWLLENLLNILMFVPLGVLTQFVGRGMKCWKIAFCISLRIEAIQLFAGLGNFEVDDLIHNTIGAVLGAVIWDKIGSVRIEWKSVRKYCVGITVVLVVMEVSCNSVYIYSHHQKMAAYATLSDEDGKKNLLVPDSFSEKIGESDINLTPLSDGQFNFRGQSSNRAWYRISIIYLPASSYSFSWCGDKIRTPLMLK